ncbi:MAG TPA: metallophosphoesterase [Gemmatimonadaceae bacterium]|nr:metallophosphoesterase [Gemmatimonadaceae bacterium]
MHSAHRPALRSFLNTAKSTLAMLAIASPLVGQTTIVRGIVFDDANGNGVRDVTERGVSGVAVSNQSDVVVTDSAGRFAIPRGTTGVLFVSTPDGYRSAGAFWRAVGAESGTTDFGLVREAQSRTFTFVHASDPHIAPANADRFRHFRALTDSLSPAFVLMGGDLIFDAMSQKEPAARAYFELFAAESRAFRMPVWTVPGNHDHFGIIPSRSHVDPGHPLYNRGMYRHYFGPDYYSFTYGGVHFIGLNSVSADDSAYYGDVDSLQLAWLKRDLALVPATTPVVTFNHIPFVSGWGTLLGYSDDALVGDVAIVNGKRRFRHTVNNVQDVIEAMRGHRYVLALGSHMHAPERLEFLSDGMRVRFEISAAIVGGNTVGPMTLPSGFTVYTVRNGEIDAGQFVHLDPTPARP